MNSRISFIEQLRHKIKCFEHKLSKYRLATNETVVVNTENGEIKGLKRMTVYNDAYYNFEGIPYAQPPVGHLRFKAPQKPAPWVGVLDCTTFRDRPLQVDIITNKVVGSEDCLYLNVYTNNIKPGKARPVMVWFHGGGFIAGEASSDLYGPDYFIQKDIVLVTVGYRLGCLGFLSMKSQGLDTPGNAGLKDQVMALKWVKNNCVSFGGDPSNITVFGESAGSASTHYMMLTDQTRDLFHRGILMSGNGLCPWAVTDSYTRSYTLAKLAGYKGADNERDVLAFLLNANPKDLIRVEGQVLTPQEHKEKVMFPFGPCVEPYITTDCVVPKHPREMVKTTWSNSIPRMIGNTSFEGLLWLPETIYAPQILDEVETCVNFVPPEIVDDPKRESESVKAKGEIIKKAHVTGDKVVKEDYFDLCSHVYFLFPMHRLIQATFRNAASPPTYIYRFDFDSEVLINVHRIMRHGRGVKGVSHADELSYLFWNALQFRVDTGSRDYRTVQRLVGIWTQFAKTGNPYSAEIDGMAPLTWDPVKPSDTVYKCLNIGDDLEVIELPEMPKIRMWESLYDGQKELF